MSQLDPARPDYSVLTVVVNGGKGSRVLRFAKRNGIAGGTVFHARGMSDKRLLRYLELYERRLEAVVMLAEQRTMRAAIATLDRRFRFSKPHHGFAFRIPVIAIAGMQVCKDYSRTAEKEDVKMEFAAIYTIVDKGRAALVIDAGKAGGATGGTIIEARGSGIHEAQKLFSMEVEPEKEVVLILARSKHVAAITQSIRDALQLDQPGNGMLFVQPVEETIGLAGEISF